MWVREALTTGREGRYINFLLDLYRHFGFHLGIINMQFSHCKHLWSIYYTQMLLEGPAMNTMVLESRGSEMKLPCGRNDCQ